MTYEKAVVIIVGAGPAGLATAGCLNQLSIPYILLEKEDCYASIWKKYSYDRLHLHLAKEFSELPNFHFRANTPVYIPRENFINYLDEYVSRFNITPHFKRFVESAAYNDSTGMWNVVARMEDSGEVEVYSGRFLVVATGEASVPFIPEVTGLERFTGEIIHSTQYKNGERFRNKRVLVVGCGNSGMEIALDLCNYGAKTSIVVRSPFHIITRAMGYLGLTMLKYHLPIRIVDFVVVMLCNLVYGDTTKYYGVKKPKNGPFAEKVKNGKYPVIDVGTHAKIKSREIKDDSYMLNEDGLPNKEFPMHWKGNNGLYCAGLARRGLHGISFDSQSIASDIKMLL